MKKMLFTLLLIAIMAMPAFAAEPVTINFWHSMDGARGESLNRLIKEFNSTHKDINVVGKFIGATEQNKDKYKNNYNILFQHLLVNISTNTPPDVAQVYENWTSQFIMIKKLVPAEDFIKSPEGFTEQEISDFVPTFLEANKYDGKIWTLPFNKSIYVLYYNKDILAEQGLKPPATWEEVLEVSKKLTKKDAQGNITRTGIGFKADVDTFSLHLLSKGSTLLDSTGTAIFNKEGGQSTIQYYKTLLAEGAGTITFEPSKDFVEGRCAMIIETTARISYFGKRENLNFGVSPCPWDKKNGKILIAGTNLAIFNTTPEKQKASWEFIKWLTNTKNTTTFSMETGYLPVRTSAIKSSEYENFLQKNEKNKVGVDQLDRGIVAPRVASWQSIRGIIDDAVFNILAVQENPQQALDNAVSLANQFLGKNKR